MYEARIKALKEAHTTETQLLKDQLALLRSLALPQTFGGHHVPVLAAEADAILTPGVEGSIEMTPAQQTEWEATQGEADRLFAGTY